MFRVEPTTRSDAIKGTGIDKDRYEIEGTRRQIQAGRPVSGPE